MKVMPRVSETHHGAARHERRHRRLVRAEGRGRSGSTAAHVDPATTATVPRPLRRGSNASAAWFSGPLIQRGSLFAMVFTPEQYRRIADTYKSAAADHTLSPAQRSGLAHKADWYRMLSRLGDKPKWAMATTVPQGADERNLDDKPSRLSSRLRSLFAWQQRQ